MTPEYAANHRAGCQGVQCGYCVAWCAWSSSRWLLAAAAVRVAEAGVVEAEAGVVEAVPLAGTSRFPPPAPTSGFPDTRHTTRCVSTLRCAAILSRRSARHFPRAR